MVRQAADRPRKAVRIRRAIECPERRVQPDVGWTAELGRRAFEPHSILKVEVKQEAERPAVPPPKATGCAAGPLDHPAKHAGQLEWGLVRHVSADT
jgi:hypothetical protein